MELSMFKTLIFVSLVPSFNILLFAPHIDSSQSMNFSQHVNSYISVFHQFCISSYSINDNFLFYASGFNSGLHIQLFL